MTTSFDEFQQTQGGAPIADRQPIGTPVGQRREAVTIPVYGENDPVVPTGQGRRPPVVGQNAAGTSPEDAAAIRDFLAQPLKDEPSSYRTEYRLVPVEARYYQGDEYTIASGLPPERRAEIQQQMRDAGLIGKDTRLTWGEWDSPTASAFAEVLAQSNVNGVTWEDQMTRLQQVAAEHPIEDTSGSQRPALTIRQTSPEDLRSVFNDSSVKLLGRRATEDELERMIGAYNAREVSAQTQQFNQTYGADGGPGPGGASFDVPSASAFAETQFEEANPGELGATRIASTFDSFLNILNRMGNG